jgi:tyrosyl-tRNA synthetase
VWLSADRISHYDYWQFWRNADDGDVGRFLRLFTLLPLDEVARLEALQGAEINEAKKILAFETTALLHGAEAATEAADTARRTFEEGEAAAGLPRHAIDGTALDGEGLALFVALAEAGLASSGSEARRLIKGGGARVNDSPVTDELRRLTPADLRDGAIKLSAGKKRHVLLAMR